MILSTLLSFIYLYLILFCLGFFFSSKVGKRVIHKINNIVLRIFTYAAFISLYDEQLTAYGAYRHSYGHTYTTDSRLSYLAAISDDSSLSSAAGTLHSCGLFSQLKADAISIYFRLCQVSKIIAEESMELPERQRRRLHFCSG